MMNHSYVQHIDIGVNLMHRSFASDRERVLERADAAGVGAIVITGTSVRSSEEAANYAVRYPGRLYSTAGVHPHDARSCNGDTLRKLRRLAEQSQVVAIGECGLDFNRDFSPRDVQERWFDAQLLLACELELPLFLHERDAFRDFVRILDGYAGRLPDAVVHCFTGTAGELDAYLSRGYYIGITGWICDERRGLALRELVKRIPLDRLMVETDAPFLTPRDLRPRPADGRNEPAFLPHVVQAIARCMNKPAQEVAEAAADNAKRFFRLS